MSNLAQDIGDILAQIIVTVAVVGLVFSIVEALYNNVGPRTHTEFTPPQSPPSCEHLYNVGKSQEWQDCMGVGPKE